MQIHELKSLQLNENKYRKKSNFYLSKFRFAALLKIRQNSEEIIGKNLDIKVIVN